MPDQYESTIERLKKEYSLHPQEQLVELDTHEKKLFIGIPCEIAFQERRIALTPNSVKSLTDRGHRIIIESGAGDGSNFSDAEYIESGAEIVQDKDRIFDADVLLKVAPVLEKETPLLREHQIIISPILLPRMTREQLQHLMRKKITAFAFEFIKGDHDIYPFIRTLSEIAGYHAILIAARYLSNEHGKGILLGSIAGHPPTKVVIIGAGGVGEAAARAAIGLGATVQVFDDNIYRLMRLQNNLGQRIYTSVLDPKALQQKLERAHVVIGAMRAERGKTPKIVTEEMVMSMKKGTVIIDVSIDHGGCIETSRVTSHNDPVFIKHDVIHYCVPNIASNVSRTASYAISNIVSPILKEAARYGGIEKFLHVHAGFRHGAYLYKGALTKEYLSERFDLKYTDLELILSAAF
jgi:alanine dehydrogenase